MPFDEHSSLCKGSQMVLSLFLSWQFIEITLDQINTILNSNKSFLCGVDEFDLLAK